MTDPMEDIIGQALLGGDKQKALNQITCNVAARTQITCTCGEVLDQETVTIIERRSDEKIIITLCPRCFTKSGHLWPVEEFRCITWNGDSGCSTSADDV